MQDLPQLLCQNRVPILHFLRNDNSDQNIDYVSGKKMNAGNLELILHNKNLPFIGDKSVKHDYELQVKS